MVGAAVGAAVGALVGAAVGAVVGAVVGGVTVGFVVGAGVTGGLTVGAAVAGVDCVGGAPPMMGATGMFARIPPNTLGTVAAATNCWLRKGELVCKNPEA